MEATNSLSKGKIDLGILSIISSILSVVLMILAGVLFVKTGIYGSLSQFFSQIFSMFYFFIGDLSAVNGKRIVLLGIYFAFGILLPFISVLLSAQALQKNNKNKVAITALIISLVVVGFYLFNLIK